jgi:hypothetical protein
MVSQKWMEPSFWCIYRIKNWKKWIKSEKVTAPRSRGKIFFQKILNCLVHRLFPCLSKKILKYYSLVLESQDAL